MQSGEWRYNSLRIVYVDWDADQLKGRFHGPMDGSRPAVEAHLLLRFPPPYEKFHHVTLPTTLVDMHGRILMWAMPGLLGRDRQVYIAMFITLIVLPTIGVTETGI